MLRLAIPMWKSSKGADYLPHTWSSDEVFINPPMRNMGQRLFHSFKAMEPMFLSISMFSILSLWERNWGRLECGHFSTPYKYGHVLAKRIVGYYRCSCRSLPCQFCFSSANQEKDGDSYLWPTGENREEWASVMLAQNTMVEVCLRSIMTIWLRPSAAVQLSDELPQFYNVLTWGYELGWHDQLLMSMSNIH